MFTYVLFHAMFNAAFALSGSVTVTWAGTVAANAVMLLFSITIVAVYNKSK